MHPLCRLTQGPPWPGRGMSGKISSAELAASLAGETALTARGLRRCAGDFPKNTGGTPYVIVGHCAPCPKGIDVASVTKFLEPGPCPGHGAETVREQYAALARGRRADVPPAAHAASAAPFRRDAGGKHAPGREGRPSAHSLRAKGRLLKNRTAAERAGIKGDGDSDDCRRKASGEIRRLSGYTAVLGGADGLLPRWAYKERYPRLLRGLATG